MATVMRVGADPRDGFLIVRLYRWSHNCNNHSKADYYSDNYDDGHQAAGLIVRPTTVPEMKPYGESMFNRIAAA